MSLFITNLTQTPLLLTVMAGGQEHERTILVTGGPPIVCGVPLQQQGLPTGGQDPIEVLGYQNGWEIELCLQKGVQMRLNQTQLDGGRAHCIALMVYEANL
jgi:hypothetical protein